MRLKRLEIQGYKSFAQRTEFLFDHGVTAIVGPNGSGKSNVADALRWVLGETNVRHLRGKKSEDLIFAGSDGRSQIGMAQVSLTLDNSTGWFRPPSPSPGRLLPLDRPTAEGGGRLVDALLASAPAEVTITRRLYRDGSGEYTINGQRARLGDVIRLLGAGGVSGDTYTVIGQGLVDQALALRAEERRVMLDEAAGIKPWQAQRDRALARLDETRANLVRVNDILTELTPQLRRLERLAARAQDHHRLSADLDELLVRWYGYQWHAAQNAAQAAEHALAAARREATERDAQVRDIVSRMETARADRERHRFEVEGLRRQAARLRDSAETVRRDLAVAEERRQHIAARRAEVTAEAETLAQTAQAAAEAWREAQTLAATATQAAADAAHNLRALQAELEQVRTDRQRHIAALETARQAASRAAHAAAEQRARLAAISERQAEMERAVAETTAIHTEHAARGAAARAQLAQAEATVATAEQAIQDGEATLADTRREAALAAASLAAAQADLDRVRDEERDAAHRRAVLADARRTHLGRAVQEVLDDPQLTGIICPLAEILDVPADLEVAVAAALGPMLHAVVVTDWEAARRAADGLDLQAVDAVTFFAANDVLRTPRVARDGVTWLADRLNARYHLGPVVQAALHDVALADDVAAARALVAHLGDEAPSLRVVTLDGCVIGAMGSITIGGTGGAAALSHEREWNALPAAADLTARIERAQQAVVQARAGVDAAGARVDTAEGEVAHRRQARDECRALLHAAEAALERAATAEAFHARALHRQREDAARVGQQAAALTAASQQATDAQARADSRLAGLNSQPLPDLAELQARVAHLQATVATAQQAQRLQAGSLDQRRTTYTQASAAAQERARRAQALSAEAETVTRRVAELRAEAERLAAERARGRGQLEPVETALAALERELRELEAETTTRRDSTLAAERALSQAQSAAREAHDRVRRLQSDIEADLDLLPRALDGAPQQLRLAFQGQAELPAMPHLPPGLEDQMRQLRAQLRRLGTPDPEALAEYTTLSERHTFLTSQVADLEKAAADLHAIIAELDAAMATRFAEVFDQVSQRFSRNFTTLFGGGSARMTMTEGGGLDILARPPGKRQQPLSLLSGGERSLTASALIFALLDVSGTPFCLLDEVDAALDEANVGRFRGALERLAARTQVILVTHNRGTIEAADAVYGVTMGGNGISQAISLRLRDRVQPAADSAAAD